MVVNESRWEVSTLMRTIEVEGQQVVQQMWVKQYLMSIGGKDTWCNSVDYVWAPLSVDVNDPSFWETQGLNNGD